MPEYVVTVAYVARVEADSEQDAIVRVLARMTDELVTNRPGPFDIDVEPLDAVNGELEPMYRHLESYGDDDSEPRGGDDDAHDV